MMDIEHWIHKLRSAGGHRGPETSEHYSYRVAGSGMGGEGEKKRASPCLVGIKFARRVRSEAPEYSSCTSCSLGYCTVLCGTALARRHLGLSSPFPAGPHYASRGQEERGLGETNTTYRPSVPPSGGGGMLPSLSLRCFPRYSTT